MKKNIRFAFIVILLAMPGASLIANPFLDCWSGIIGAQAGVAISSSAGKSKTFAPITPSDEYYKYSPHHKSQTKALYGGFVGAKWQGVPDWDIQFDVNYAGSSPFSVNGTLTQGIDVQSQDVYRYKYKIALRQVLFETKISYLNCNFFKPYATVGIGSSFNRAYSFSTTVPSLLTFTRTYKNKTTSGFTYAFGVGVDFEITKCLYIGAGYQFSDFGKATLGSSTIDDVSVSGTLSQSHFYANEFFAQLTFIF